MNTIDVPSRFVVKTLGCKANLSDGDRIESELKRRGWLRAEPGDAVDLCIVNSCTVTDEADRQSRKLASKLGRENPKAVVVLTGCAAEVDPERLSGTPGVHYIIGNRAKPELVDEILKKIADPERVILGAAELLGKTSGYSEVLSRHPEDREWPSVDVGGAGELGMADLHTRSFLKIQEGCNSFCTYCIIPYGRGPSRSLRPLEIVRAVREACELGTREVILTGTNIGDYGTDWSDRPELASLLKTIFDATDIERVRLSSLDPTEITDELFELMESEPRLCAHFHVSLQSVSDRVLRLMKRRYGYREVEACLTRVQKLQPASASSCFVGMDLITGFPGETEEDYAESLQKLKSLSWSRLHVFPYSERKGTPATRLSGSVPQATRLARARKLQKLSLERVSQRARAHLGQPVLSGVLLERPYTQADGSKWVTGLTSDYQRVVIAAGEASQRNRLIQARPTRLELKPASGEAVIHADFVS